MTPSLVVFDLGGTTIQDRGEVPVAFAAALDASDLKSDAMAIASWRGASKREVLRRLVNEQRAGLSPARRQALVATVYETFRTMLTDQLRAAPDLAIPDAQATFERLKRAGIRVALNSGFDRSIVQVILVAAAWPIGLVDVVICSEDVPAGRPAPFMIFRSMEHTGVGDVRRVAVVGDTRLDLEAAANAGVSYRIGVLTGAHDRATLERAPHSHILDSIAQIPNLWLT